MCIQAVGGGVVGGFSHLIHNMSIEYFDDVRIEGYDPLIPPQILQYEEPLVIHTVV
jgi:hypothetical protein